MKTLNYIAVVLWFAGSVLAHAQSITVIGSNGDARECAFAARRGASGSVTARDLDACQSALDESIAPRDRAATYVNRGILFAALERYQEAMNDYNAALDMQADLPQAFNGKGNLYYLSGRYDEAIAAYERALALRLPERHLVHFNLGLTYERLQDNASAVQHYEAAQAAAPEWTEPGKRLARLQQASEKP